MLRIVNGYSQTMWVAIWYYHPNCPDGGNWSKKGWWQIPPGEQDRLRRDLDNLNRYYCYHAHASDGVHWSGPYVTPCPPQAFNWCLNTANTQSIDRGFRLLDINSHDNYTLTLHG
jgi:uncharacterized membrane protein